MKRAIEQLPEKVRYNARSTYAQFVAKGKEEGKLEGKIEVILTGYDNGASIDFLSTITHLSETEVTEILQKHGKM